MVLDIPIKTSIPGLGIRRLSEEDTPLYLKTIQDNAYHLTRYGDYQEQVRASISQIVADVLVNDERHLKMGIWFKDIFIGRVDINHAEDNAYILGYWLSSNYTGKGYGYESCKTLIDFVYKKYSIFELWAGVRHENNASIKLLKKLGFTEFEKLSDRSRYRLILTRK